VKSNSQYVVASAFCEAISSLKWDCFDGRTLSRNDMVSVEVLDHLVIGEGKWVSLKEKGLGFV
jgi:hypothetical protein